MLNFWLTSVARDKESTSLLITMSVAQPLLATIEADEPLPENTNSSSRSQPAPPQTPRQMATTESDAESGPLLITKDYIRPNNRILYRYIGHFSSSTPGHSNFIKRIELFRHSPLIPSLSFSFISSA